MVSRNTGTSILQVYEWKEAFQINLRNVLHHITSCELKSYVNTFWSKWEKYFVHLYTCKTYMFIRDWTFK